MSLTKYLSWALKLASPSVRSALVQQKLYYLIYLPLIIVVNYDLWLLVINYYIRLQRILNNRYYDIVYSSLPVVYQ